MQFETLIKMMAEQLELPQDDVKTIYVTTIKKFRATLGKQNSFRLPGCGTFLVHKRDKRKVFNPFIEKFMILPPKLSVKFRPSSTLKEGVRNEHKA